MSDHSYSNRLHINQIPLIKLIIYVSPYKTNCKTSNHNYSNRINILYALNLCQYVACKYIGCIILAPTIDGPGFIGSYLS